MKSLLKTILFAVLPLAAAGPEARFTVPFDGTPESSGNRAKNFPKQGFSGGPDMSTAFPERLFRCGVMRTIR